MAHKRRYRTKEHIPAMIEVAISLASNIITASVTWLLARRKNIADARKAEAEAKASELDVIEDAIKIWRELAEDLKKEVQRLSDDNKALKCEVGKLRLINNKILRALDKINADNAEMVVNQLKKDIGNESID
ncbi:MAG: hypothetical protein WHS63_07215 [Tenuifilum sp.]